MLVMKRYPSGTIKYDVAHTRMKTADREAERERMEQECQSPFHIVGSPSSTNKVPAEGILGPGMVREEVVQFALNNQLDASSFYFSKQKPKQNAVRIEQAVSVTPMKLAFAKFPPFRGSIRTVDSTPAREAQTDHAYCNVLRVTGSFYVMLPLDRYIKTCEALATAASHPPPFIEPEDPIEFSPPPSPQLGVVVPPSQRRKVLSEETALEDWSPTCTQLPPDPPSGMWDGPK